MAKKGRKKKKPDLRGYATTSAPSKKDLAKGSEAIEKAVEVASSASALVSTPSFSTAPENEQHEMNAIAGHEKEKEKLFGDVERRLEEHSLLASTMSKAVDFDAKKSALFKSNPAIGRIALSKSQEANLFDLIASHPLSVTTMPRVTKEGWKSASDLKGAYLRLEKLGLAQDFLEAVIENCPFASFDQIVTWMCINYSIGILPPGLTDKFEHDTVDADLKTVAPTQNDEKDDHYVELQANTSKQDHDFHISEEPLPAPREEIDFNKRWILERAEADDSNDDSSTYSDTPKESSKESLEAELIEWSEQAALAKDKGDKEMQRKCGKEIGRLKKLVGSVSIQVQVKTSDLLKSEAPVEENGDSDEGMFFSEEVMDRLETDASVSSSVRIVVRDMGTLKSKYRWSGMTSCQLLQEYVSKKFSGSNLKYSVDQVFANAFQASLSISHTILKFKMDREELVSTKEDAKLYVATKALYTLLEKDVSITSRLPPAFSDLYKEWIEKEKEAANSELVASISHMDEFVERVMRERDSMASQSLIPASNTLSISTGIIFNEDRKMGIQRRQIPSLSDWNKKINNPLLQQRKSLPVFQHRQRVVDLINGNQVIVLSSETGSGKSTQIPTFLLQSAIESGSPHFDLICTQPRRISAVSLASRVAQEIGYSKSSLVGYQVKNDSTVSESTMITFCTTGLLLRRMVSDPTLASITHIVIDECHERTLDSDFLLLLVKKLIQVRSDLRVVLMSATANADLFASYFQNGLPEGSVPTISIPGRSFPVSASFLLDVIAKTRYLPTSDSEFVLKRQGQMRNAGSVNVSGRGGNQYKVKLVWQENIEEESDFDGYENQEGEEGDNIDDLDGDNSSQLLLEKAAKIMNCLDPKKINFELISHIIRYILDENPAGCSDGSCIVFLPGVGEINRLAEALENDFLVGSRASSQGKNSSSPILVLPLHGGLTNDEQSLVFAPAPKGKLKVVLSTNVAETGVTIPDAVYVIDTLRAREIRHDPKRGISRLADTLISKANALQRRGRAGRVRPGFAFHLIPEESFQKLPDQQTPEMQRLPLEEICLKMRMTMPSSKSLSIQDLFQEMLDPPSFKSVTQACKLLLFTEALDENEELTRLGEFLGQLPVDIRVGKLLLTGLWLGCIDSCLTIASLLTAGKSPFVYPSHSLQQAKTAHAVFYRDNSDILAWVAAYHEWENMWLDGKSQSAVRTFCQLRYLNFEVLLSVYESRLQLLQSLSLIGLVDGKSLEVPKRQSKYPKNRLVLPSCLNQYSKDAMMNSVAYTVGLYPNVVFKSPSSLSSPSGSLHLSNSTQNQNLTTKLHSNSTLNVKTLPSGYYTYNSIQIKSLGGKSTCLLYDLNISFGPIYPLLAARSVDYKPMQGVFILDDGVVIHCIPRSASILLQYRKLLRSSFAQFLCDPLSEDLHSIRHEFAASLHHA